MQPLLLGVVLLTVEPRAVDRAWAAHCFSEARRLSARDDGKLWGTVLYGPMIFVEPASRNAVANQSDAEGRLTRDGDVFVGTLPMDVPLANTAVQWSSVKWTMILWPLPQDEHARATLMLHECFHRVQDDIGLRGTDPANPHLDTLEGRYWMRLEWRALAGALRAEGDARRQAIEDALLFRARRRTLFPGAAASERALENHEGLAEYTGLVLSDRRADERILSASQALAAAESKSTFVRSFAYASGPAYGLLLDNLEKAWRKDYKVTDDLSERLRAACGVEVVSDDDLKRLADQRAGRYGGAELRTAETARARQRQERLVQFRRRLVDGPVLRIPCQSIKVEFDPSTLIPLDDLGTVYPTLRGIDAWGKLDVTDGGALLSSDWRLIRVAAPPDRANPLRGSGWTLELKPGWKVVPGERTGDFEIKHE